MKRGNKIMRKMLGKVDTEFKKMLNDVKDKHIQELKELPDVVFVDSANYKRPSSAKGSRSGSRKSSHRNHEEIGQNSYE